MLFSAKTEEYLSYHRDTLNNSAGEMEQKRLCLKNHLLPYFGEMTFDAITTRNINEYTAAKRRSGLANSTINHHLTILGSYLRHAEDNGNLIELPKVRLIRMPQKNEMNYLTPSEVKRLYIAADKHRKPGWRLIMMVAANTGMRIGELLALDWKQVNLSRRKIYIKASYCRKLKAIKGTKNGDERHIDLTETAFMALRDLHVLEGSPESGLVMHTNYDTAQRAMRITSRRAGLGKEVTWHTLRHTFATALVSMGQPLYVVAKLLGHKNLVMAERYTHLTRERGFAAIRDLDGIL